MRDEPLLSITRVVDNDFDPETVGSLDFRVHCQPLERWLAGSGDVAARRAEFATELRSLAAAIETRTYPFVVTIEAAEDLAARRRKAAA